MSGWEYLEYELTNEGDFLTFIDGGRMDTSSGACYKIGANGEDIQEISQDEYNDIDNSFYENELKIEYIPMSSVY